MVMKTGVRVIVALQIVEGLVILIVPSLIVVLVVQILIVLEQMEQLVIVNVMEEVPPVDIIQILVVLIHHIPPVMLPLEVNMVVHVIIGKKVLVMVVHLKVLLSVVVII